MVLPLISAGLSIGGALLQSSQANKAAKARQRANADADAMLQSQFEAIRGSLNPFIEPGQKATGLYADALGVNGAGTQQQFYDNFQFDPGFQRSLEEGARSTMGAFAGQGNALSGGAIRAVRDSTGQAVRDAFTNRLNQLSGLGQTGQNAATNLAGIRNSFAGQRSNAITGGGNAVATGYEQVGNIIGGAVNAGNSLLGRQSSFDFLERNPGVGAGSLASFGAF